MDIRYVWFDDRVNNFKDCIDQIYVEWISEDQFKMENPEYENLDMVGIMSKNDTVFWNFEEQGKLNNKLVKKLHYWNKQADRYIVIYNDSIIGRDTPIPYAHKELPIVPRQYSKVMNSIYGV